LRLTPTTEGFIWDDIRKIFRGWVKFGIFYPVWYLGHPLTFTKILRRSSQRNHFVRGVKRKRGSQI